MAKGSPNNSQDDRRVHVNEQTRDFVERVEDERVPPCDDSASQRA